MKFPVKMLMPALASVAMLASAPARADQLADVKAARTLVCGVLDIFEPFGYTDPVSRAVVGYDVDVCTALGKQMGVRTEVKPVSIEARIPELLQKHMDVLAAGLAYSPQRAEQVSYSDAYYVSNNILAARTGRGYRHTADLAGKRISFVKGSISEGYIKAALPTARIVGYEDVSTAFTVLLQRKVEAFSTSEEVLQKLRSRLGPDVSNFAVMQPPIGREIWGLGVRKDEPAMLKTVNDALRALEASGEMQAIFDKWLGPRSLYKMQRSFKVEPIR